MKPIEEKTAAERQKEMYGRFLEEVKQNELFPTFLPGISPKDLADFRSHYAQQKVYWIEYGETCKENAEYYESFWVEEAYKRLGEIQQKKLFDVQCKWLAEQITFNEIRISYDFRDWERNILNCPIIPPVSQYDIDIYQQYILSSNFDCEDNWESWQDHKAIKEAYNSNNANRNFPEWYDFYNGRTGASAYLLLPDVRTPKEDFYFGLGAREFMENQLGLKPSLKPAERARIKPDSPPPQSGEAAKEMEENTGEPNPEFEPIDTRPFLDTLNSDFLPWFVSTFEDAKTQALFKRVWKPIDYYEEFTVPYFERVMETLCQSEEQLPIEGWHDWREALKKTYDNYRKRKIAEALPVAFDQYLTHLELGLGFPVKEVGEGIFGPDYHARMILRGRYLNGEPEDFDF